MAGHGPPPKPAAQRRSGHRPIRGEWRSREGIGWQHGGIPDPPAGLSAAARDAWQVWMTSWFAAHWSPADLPVLRLVVKLYSLAGGSQASPALRGELRQLMDSYGITPKGRQDRRWVEPEQAQTAPARRARSNGAIGPYGHLRVVGGDA